MLPIAFQECMDEFSPRSHLLSLSFSSSSPTCLYVDEVLTSQTERIYPFAEGGAVFVLGSSLTHSSPSSPSHLPSPSSPDTLENEVMTKEDVMEEIGVLISSVNVIQGDLDEEYLSRQYMRVDNHLKYRCLYGPLFYHLDQLPPHTEPASYLLSKSSSSSSSSSSLATHTLLQVFHTDLSHIVHSDDLNADCFCLYVNQSVLHIRQGEQEWIQNQVYDGERHCLWVDRRGVPFVFCKSFIPFM